MKQVVIHHSASDLNTTVEQINQWHKDRGFPESSLGYYIGYHFIITADGKITRTRGDWEIGCHCVPNENKVGVCLTGNFNNYSPTKEQLDSLGDLLGSLKLVFYIDDNSILPHKYFKATECPGKNLEDWLKLYKKVGFLTKAVEEVRIKVMCLLNKKEIYINNRN
jgi:N-acetylmuramoyl-L-alanine amidase